MREEYHVESGRRTCLECGRQFEPGEEYLSGLAEVEPDEAHPHGLARRDYCEPHWPQGDGGPAWVAFWRTQVPEPEEPKKKRLVIDDERMMDVFFRLGDTGDALKLDVRYVVGLMLIRRRRLKLEGTRRRGGRSVMLVRKSRHKEIFELEDRPLSDEAVLAVSGEIAAVLDLADRGALEETDDES